VISSCSICFDFVKRTKFNHKLVWHFTVFLATKSNVASTKSNVCFDNVACCFDVVAGVDGDLEVQESYAHFSVTRLGEAISRTAGGEKV